MPRWADSDSDSLALPVGLGWCLLVIFLSLLLRWPSGVCCAVRGSLGVGAGGAVARVPPRGGRLRRPGHAVLHAGHAGGPVAVLRQRQPKI